MILNWITIIFLTLVILLFIYLIKYKSKEDFSTDTTSMVFHNDDNIRNKFREIDETVREYNKLNNIAHRENVYNMSLDNIEEATSRFDKIFDFITENINNIKTCREIDLRWDLKPLDASNQSLCSNRDNESCELNPYCELSRSATNQVGIATSNNCVEKTLKDECENIMLAVSGNLKDSAIAPNSPSTNRSCTAANPCLREKASEMFLYPDILQDVVNMNNNE